MALSRPTSSLRPHQSTSFETDQLTVIANLNDNICHLNTEYSSLKQKNESLNNQMKQILELKEQREQKLVEALTEQSLQQLLMNIETQDSNESIKNLEDLVNELNSKLEMKKIESLKQIELKCKLLTTSVWYLDYCETSS